jgi:hypothetical protein
MSGAPPFQRHALVSEEARVHDPAHPAGGLVVVGAALGLGFARMARRTERLQIGRVVAAAQVQRKNVVNLQRGLERVAAVGAAPGLSRAHHLDDARARPFAFCAPHVFALVYTNTRPYIRRLVRRARLFST